jgi:UDP-N-acetylglucosamine 2-epimerase (non-hydrolysing)
MLMRKCELIITDSGGIQEEATAPEIQKPVVVIRLSTERQEAVESGFALVAGTGEKEILDGIEKAMEKKHFASKSPFGDGHSAEKIVEIIEREITET